MMRKAEEKDSTDDRQALRRLRVLLGRNACYRMRKDAPTVKERAVLAEQKAALVARRDAARVAMEARRAELLSDPAYLELVRDWKETRDGVVGLLERLRERRITAGRNEGPFFSVEAEGDTWDEVIATLEAKAKSSDATPQPNPPRS